MANFKIKYLDSYPVATFYESFEYPEAVFDGYFWDIIKTERKWGHVYDSIKSNRTIQYIVYELYKAEIIIGRNIDLSVLQGSNHVLVTPDYGDPFNALDFNIEFSDTSSRDKRAVVTFRKQREIRYPLSSDYAESIHSTSNVNVLSFTVEDPSYVFNYVSLVINGSSIVTFTVPNNDYTNTILVGDIFYMHTNNTIFNAATDDSGDYMNFAECTIKTSSLLTFECSNSTYVLLPKTTINNMVLDFNPDYRALPSGVVVSGKTLSVDIYTFVEPFFDHITEFEEGLETNAGVEYNKWAREYDRSILKVWLKTSELYKIEFLNYASDTSVVLDLDNYDDIAAVQIKGISQVKQNDELLNIYEFDIEILYNINQISKFQ
jgi:hypothetical protein